MCTIGRSSNTAASTTYVSYIHITLILSPTVIHCVPLHNIYKGRTLVLFCLFYPYVFLI